jgi:hypothetical protein
MHRRVRHQIQDRGKERPADLGGVYVDGWPLCLLRHRRVVLSLDGHRQARTNKLVPQGQWGAGGTFVPTQPAAKVKEGETVCFSGITTPQLSCGPVTEITEYWAGTEKEQAARSGFWVKFRTPANYGDSGAAVWSVFGPSVGLIDAKGEPGEKHGENETFVEPLLTPPSFNRFVEPGLLEDPAFAPMSLKIASDEE